MKTQLLCTFTQRDKLDDILELIILCNEVLYNKIYVFQNGDDYHQLICTYNVEYDAENHPEDIPNTISLHRKKQTNTLYTINALNNLVQLLNDGEIDPTFPIEWENYRNMLLVTNDSGYGLKKIKTKVDKIVKL